MSKKKISKMKRIKKRESSEHEIKNEKDNDTKKERKQEGIDK